MTSHCKNGHPQTVETVRVSKAGYRECRICRRERARELYERYLRATAPYQRRAER